MDDGVTTSDRMKLIERIAKTKVATGEVAIFSLAQAGFVFKSSAGALVCLDGYFSDCCKRLAGLRRMIPPPMTPEELPFDVVVATHAHPDHLDIDALPVLTACGKTHFLAAADCRASFAEVGLASERYTLLTPGQSHEIAAVGFRGVYADHGDLAPEAIGLVMDFDGVRVYNTGDTAYRPRDILASLDGPVDIMIAPINGAYGNLNEAEAVKLAADVQPKIIIGCHFGMFVEHGGSPTAFLAEAKKNLPNEMCAMVLAPGETLLYTRETGEIRRQTLPTNM